MHAYSRRLVLPHALIRHVLRVHAYSRRLVFLRVHARACEVFKTRALDVLRWIAHLRPYALCDAVRLRFHGGRSSESGNEEGRSRRGLANRGMRRAGLEEDQSESGNEEG
eukprot:3746482-Pleurochrysis_carterae.AAC.1